jgi:hypothetical protein
VAALAALSVTTPALLALASSPASAGTSSGSITCTNPDGSPPGTPDAPFVLSYTATPAATAFPTGAAYSVTGVFTVTVTGAVVAGLKDSPLAATEVGFAGGKFALTATNTTGALTSPNLGPKPSVPITGYVADPDGAGPLTSTANDITFTFPGVTYSGATTAGADGQSVIVSLSSNQSTSGLSLLVTGGLSLNLGWGTPGMGGFIESTNGHCLGVGAPYPSLGSTTLAKPAAHTFTNTAKPKVAGTAKVGKTLTCKPGSWSPAPATTAFKWLRDGKAIKKAVKAKYKIVKADARHKLSCSVTVSAPGYTPATATSGKTKKVPTP